MVMVPNNWSINIAVGIGEGWNGEPAYSHFAAVELGQMLEEKALERFKVFEEKFPWPEYRITMAEIRCTGHEIVSNDPGKAGGG